MKTNSTRGQARGAILEKSLSLFASRGVEAVSVRDIAAETGFSNPALFRHFPTKEALARALFETCYQDLIEALESARDADFSAWLTAALDQIERHPDGVLYVLDNLKRYWPELPDDLKRRALPNLVTELIEREIAAGRMRADVAPRLMAMIIFGTLGQIARSVHFHESRIDPAALAAELSNLMIQGLAPQPGPGELP